MRVLVVGAGLGGLSAACHLSGQGHEVTVLEREQVPGGRAGLWQEEGFSFDTGPSVLTMTGILGDVFKAAGADMNDYLDLAPVDPMYRATFPDGSTLHSLRGIDAMRDEIARVCGQKEADAFPRFCQWLRDLYELEMPNFIDRNFDGPLSMAWPPSPLVQLVKLGGLRKLAAVVGDHFEDPRLRRLFSFQALYAGMSPFEALAVYGVITYMDSVEGVFYPKGGMHSIPTGLAAAATKAGAEFHYGVTVEKILRTSSGVNGVLLSNGETLHAEAVVANPDVPAVYRELLGDVDMPRVARKGEYSPSCVVWHAGVRGDMPSGAAHHNIHFGDQWEEAFVALMKTGTLMPDPSILVTAPTVSDPSQAPDGCSSLFVLEPVPNLDGNIDWSAERDRVQARLTERVAGYGYPTDVVVDRFVDPLDWKRQGMEKGTPFALSHRFFQTGPFRPNNVDGRVPGLTLVGSGTLPGVGVPMVLLSGRLAAERVGQSK